MDNQFLNKGTSGTSTPAEAKFNGEKTFTTAPPASPSIVSSVSLSENKMKALRLPIAATIIGIVIFIVFIGGVILFARANESSESTDAADRYESKPLELDDIGQLATSPTGDIDRTIGVNGQFTVNGSFILTPSTQPKNPVAGQIYYDQNTNQLAYYNGQQFLNVLGTTTNLTNVTNLFSTTNTTNIIGGGSGNDVQLQSTSPGTQQTGNFNISGTGTVSLLSTPAINNTGNLSVTTSASAGSSGSISIKTGDSSATASGNITVDTGAGIVTGTVVNHKTFESGIENMLPWTGAGCTTAQSFAQARTGAASLAMTGSNFCSMLEDNNFPVIPIVAGHNYHFSAWVRADTTGALITGFVDLPGPNVTLTSVTDTTTGWTQMTGQGVATADGFAFWSFGFNQGTVQTHYFDDMVTTDLSSSTAVSEINIGTTNAQFVNIGNVNQLGPTKIFGSGITLNGGVGTVSVNGGAININGSGSSSLVTSSGSLTVQGTDTSTWGIGTKTTNGVGGDLTIHAGAAFGGNFVGGNLILRGGEGDGTATDGSLIVRPHTDNTAVFQIQDTTTTGFFTADSSNYAITIAGTNTKYASLTIIDAHVKSTQTTPPTIGTPSNCGTSPTAAVTAGSTDTAGSFTITTGTGGTSSTCDTVFTFNQAYGAAPKSIVVVGKTDAASALRQIYVSAVNSTTFTVSFATSAGGADSTTYNFNYWVIE